MRVCDRCQDVSKPSVRRIVDKRTETEYELCTECNKAFDIFMAERPMEQTTRRKKESKK